MSSAGENMGELIIDTLQAQGVEVRKPFLFDFYFYAPTEEAATRLAAELSGMGYQVEVGPSAADEGENGEDGGDSIFLCLASALIVPEEGALNQLGRTFEELAARHGSEFDGWETGID